MSKSRLVFVRRSSRKRRCGGDGVVVVGSMLGMVETWSSYNGCWMMWRAPPR